MIDDGYITLCTVGDVIKLDNVGEWLRYTRYVHADFVSGDIYVNGIKSEDTSFLFVGARIDYTKSVGCVVSGKVITKGVNAVEMQRRVKNEPVTFIPVIEDNKLITFDLLFND